MSLSSRNIVQSTSSVTAATLPSPSHCCRGVQHRRGSLTTTRAWSELIAASAAIPASPYFPVAAAGFGAFSYAYVLPFWQNTRPMAAREADRPEVAGTYKLYNTNKKSKTVSGTTSKRVKAGTIRIKAK
uniref:Uncharacterized protein n=1 Tax=Tetradesmus obliquus TaxID=3088 RepID=A0A383WQ34_TETOB|eukprot:jgi/Sobl393_1/19833/SZX78846.1